MRTPRLTTRPLAGCLLLLVLTGCTTEKIVFRDREPFNEPPVAAQGFLGYFTVNSKTTTCGNCHVTTQRDWKTTKHAKAYATIENNSGKQDFCFGCHTVNERGNRISSPAGWNAVKDSVYRDVQCETCHGPGLEHVKVPDVKANRPFARAGLAVANASCEACHSGSHHPFADEWKQSGHASIVSSAAGREGCESCHNGKAVLTAWGENASYVEKDSTGFLATVCVVCHDPHGSAGNPKQLRFPVTSADPERNLCMKCHIRRTEPAGGSSYGLRPHAPQGAVLLGTAGYRPAGFTYDTARILTSHASERNPRLCAGCHVNRFTVTDPTSGNFVFSATGHLFRPAPCLDAQGKPTADKTCAYTETARSFAGCTASGCHATEAIAAQRLTGVRSDIENLAATLWIDTNGNGNVDAAPTDQGWLPTVKQTRPAEFTPDQTITAAEGAEFNVRLVAERGQSNTDNSKGVHNPFLARSLLSASINEVRAVYGFPAPPMEVQTLVSRSLDQVKTRQPNLFPRASNH